MLFVVARSFLPFSRFVTHAAPFRPHRKATLGPRKLGNQPASHVSLETSNLPLALVGSQARDQESPLFLNAIVLVAGGNLMLNIVRPEPLIIWQVRTQRTISEILNWGLLTFYFYSILLPFAVSLPSHALGNLYHGDCYNYKHFSIQISHNVPRFGVYVGNDSSGRYFSVGAYLCNMGGRG